MIEQATKAMVNVTIDGQPIAVEKGTTLFEAARRLNIAIPHYCYDRDLTIVASCRLCLVEIDNVPKLQPSCSTPVNEGQIIHTQSPNVLDARKMQMEFLLVQHPLDCPVCDQGGECKLQEYSMNHGLDETRFRYQRRTFPKPDIGPFVDLERNRCILCTRCTRFMEEIAGDAELAIVSRGNRAFISTFQNQPLKNEFAGNTIDLCPVGALTSKITRFRSRPWELKSAPAVCSLCAVGCNVNLQFRNRTKEILRVLPRRNDEVNGRWICDIGRFGFDQFNSPERQRVPLMRNAEGRLEESKWSRVITQSIQTLKTTAAQHGAGSIAGLIAPRASNETLYLFQKLLRDVIGTGNIDHRTESRINENEDGFLTSLALGAANHPFEEVREATTILVLGSDLPNELPIIKLQVRSRAVDPSNLYDSYCRPFTPSSVYVSPERLQQTTQVLIAHSRPTRLDPNAAQALHYRPGAELLFVALLLKIVAQEKGVPLPESVKTAVNTLNLETEFPRCGVETQAARAFAQALTGAARPTILVGESMFGGREGVDRVLLIGALASLLKAEGQTRLPFSLLLPYNNSRGAADLGCYPHRGPGFQPLPSPGKNTTEILQGCVDGSIQALILFQTDILNEYPDRPLAEAALKKVPFLLVADAYPTKTQSCAHVFCPLSTYTEEDGTYTNVAGRVQRAHKALDQLEGSLAGYQLLLALGDRWGAHWSQVDSRKLTVRLAEAAAHYKGFSWDALGLLGSRPNELDPALFKDCRKTLLGDPSASNGSVPEGCLRWVRGRSLFDTAAEKRFAPALVERSETCAAEIHPHDAIHLQIHPESPIRITGERGSLELPVRVSPDTMPGCVTVLGFYEGLPLNGVASEESPWVTIQQ